MHTQLAPLPADHVPPHSARARASAPRQRLTVWLASVAGHALLLLLAASFPSARAHADQGRQEPPDRGEPARVVHIAAEPACTAPGTPTAAPALPWRRLRDGGWAESPTRDSSANLALSPSRITERAHLRRMIARLDGHGPARPRRGSFDPLLWGPGAASIDRLGCWADDQPLSAVATLYRTRR